MDLVALKLKAGYSVSFITPYGCTLLSGQILLVRKNKERIVQRANPRLEAVGQFRDLNARLKFGHYDIKPDSYLATISAPAPAPAPVQEPKAEPEEKAQVPKSDKSMAKKKIKKNKKV